MLASVRAQDPGDRLSLPAIQDNHSTPVEPPIRHASGNIVRSEELLQLSAADGTAGRTLADQACDRKVRAAHPMCRQPIERLRRSAANEADSARDHDTDH